MTVRMIVAGMTMVGMVVMIVLPVRMRVAVVMVVTMVVVVTVIAFLVLMRVRLGVSGALVFHPELWHGIAYYTSQRTELLQGIAEAVLNICG